jgi:hypothetical protein
MKQTKLHNLVNTNVKRSLVLKDAAGRVRNRISEKVGFNLVTKIWHHITLRVHWSTKLPLDSTESVIKQFIDSSNKNP